MDATMPIGQSQRHAEPLQRICPCGAPIPSGKRSDAEFCSEACRVRIWDKNHPRLGVSQRRIEWTPSASRIQTKRLGKREAMLARLRQGPARTYELMALGGSGFSARLRELRDQGTSEGYDILCEEDGDGATYTLVQVR